MAELTKQALKVENNTNFPNNTTGYITPALLREFNTDMIDSMVDEIPYGAYTQSVATSINALNQFTASASGLSTGSLLVTASAVSNVITFTKGDSSQFNVTIADTTNLGPLNTFTASAEISLNNLNIWTSSYQPVITNLETSQSIDNTKFNTIGGQSGSWDNTNLNAYTASNNTKWDNLGAQSGSFVTESETGSFARINVANTFTAANTFTSISASSFVSASEFVGNGAKLTGITASVSLPILDEGIPQGNAVSMNFTGSGISATIVGGTAIVSVNTPDSGTINNLTASFNSYTSSNNQKWDNIALQSGSWGANDLTSLNAFTASQDTKNSTLASVTASLQQQLTNIGSQSGSWITESETGSFARYDVNNPWSANQTFTNITAVSASFQYVQTTYETSSVIYSSGSNQFGDAADDIQTLYGSVRVVNELTASGLHYPTADGTAGQFLVTNGAASLTFDDVHVISEAVRYGENITIGDPLYVSGSNGTYPIVWKADASNPAKMPVIYIASSTNVTNTNTTAITLGLITGVTTTGYTAGTTIYVGEGGGWTASRPSGSNSIVQPLGIVTKEGPGGSGRGLVLNPGPATLPNIQTGYAWVGNGGNQPVAIATSSFGSPIETGSFATTGSNTFDGNQIISGGLTLSGSLGITYVDGGAEVIQQVTALGNYQTLYDGGLLFQTDGVNNYEQTIHTTLSKGLTVDSGSVLNNGATINGGFTASLQQGYAWVGDVTGKNMEVPTSSFGTPINTGSFATTGSNVFTGDQTLVDPAGNSVTLSDTSGSLMLVAKTYTSASAHLTGSSNTFVNLIFKNNNNTADTIISGSNNIFLNPSAPTAGFKRYIGGSNNIFNTLTLPQISGSMGFSPAMTGNIGTGLLNMRGPLSASAWNFTSNLNLGTIQIGPGAVLNAEKLTSTLNMVSNTIQGTVSIIANQSALTGSTNSFNNNSVNGGVQLDLSSSAAAMSNNIINDTGFLLTNRFYSSSVGLGVLNANRNTIGGQSNQIIATGALPTTNVTSISDNVMLGGSNILFVDIANARVSGSSAYHNTVRNILLGNQLIVSGSGLLSDQSSAGSVFVGRFNADDARRNRTSDVVFAVGTGNTTARKTGFLIDSGSNTFVEGTLNVSGSSSYTGSVYGNVVSMSVTSNTASMDFSLGNYFELTSSASPLRIELSNIKGGQTTTLILSASVSSSIAFSSNVGQPSPGAYSGSVTASVDILSFVAFNNTKVNLVATKNIV